VRVFAPDGTHLGTIETKHQPSNLEFGGPGGSDLFVTARTVVYRLPTKAKKAPLPSK